MRFFSGGRDGKKKHSASALYKQKMSGKTIIEKTPEEKYKEAIETKMQKMMEDAIMGRKKQVGMPGVKSKLANEDEKPRELSKNAQMMLKLLAMQKLRQEDKKEKKKLRDLMMVEKAKKKAAYALAKAAQDAIEYEQRQAAEAMAAAAASQTTYSYGYTTSSDDNNGW